MTKMDEIRIIFSKLNSEKQKIILSQAKLAQILQYANDIYSIISIYKYTVNYIVDHNDEKKQRLMICHLADSMDCLLDYQDKLINEIEQTIESIESL